MEMLDERELIIRGLKVRFSLNLNEILRGLKKEFKKEKGFETPPDS